MDKEISIDEWKPSEKSNKIIQGEWRKKLIGDNFDQTPSLDDFKKIKMYLKREHSDSEIMGVFGINANTLMAIKEGRFCPIDGIELDNLSKVYNEFQRIDKRANKMEVSIKYLVKFLFKTPEELEKYNEFCKEEGRKKNKNSKIQQETIA